MYATEKQINLLNSLSKRAQAIKRYHPSLIPMGLYPQTFELGLTKEEAGLRIQMYKHILANCDIVLPKKAVQGELFQES